MTRGPGVPTWWIPSRHSGGTPAPSRGFRRTAVAAVVTTYLLVVVGGVVRVSGSGRGCGVSGQDWPLCHGRFVPPADAQTLIEFSHRMLATISTVLVLTLALWAWRSYRHLPRVVRAMFAQIVRAVS